MFLDSCKSDTELADKYLLKSDELRIIEEERNDIFAEDGDNVTTHSEKNGIVTTSEDGLIETVNNRLLKLFGYNKSELIGRNVNVLVPHPWKELHNRFISTYNQTGACHVMGSSRSVYGLHKQGHSFAMKFDLRESHTEDRRRIFVAMITEEIPSDGVVTIMADSVGQIQGASESVLKVFGWTASEIIGEDIRIIMPDSRAFSHVGCMKRYIETGEGTISMFQF
jgi:two-component system sensor kinase FixL